MVTLEHFVRFHQVNGFFGIVINETNKYDDIVPCASTPCENGGKCELLIGNNYGCVCPNEYTGTRCETYILGR
jgi:hypothetical protein